MHNLPAGIQREFDAALQRTGDTPQLQRARVWLPAVLRLTPEQFDTLAAGLLQRM